MRQVTSLLVTTTADLEQLAAAADDFERFAEALAALPVGQVYQGYSEAANAGQAMGEAIEAGRGVAEDDPERFASFDYSPIMGLSNPLSPPIVMDYEEDGGSVVAHVTFGPAYEGPPGCVHGGFVAAVFDDVLGATQSLSGTQGMTAHLAVDYRSPSPLGVPLHLRGWVDRHDGRKIWARAEMRAEDRLCAEATALFIAMTPEVFQRLLDDRDARGAGG
jgi:acyl-coenzyme A thioesterase PaaI-like protein